MAKPIGSYLPPTNRLKSARGIIARTREQRTRWLELVRADKSLGSGPKVTAGALEAHQNSKSGALFPSLTTLGRETAFCQRTIERHISILRDAGYLQWIIGGGRRSNSYNLLFPNTNQVIETIKQPSGWVEQVPSTEKVIHTVDDTVAAASTGSATLPRHPCPTNLKYIPEVSEEIIGVIRSTLGRPAFDHYMRDATIEIGDIVCIWVGSPVRAAVIRTALAGQLDALFGAGSWTSKDRLPPPEGGRAPPLKAVRCDANRFGTRWPR